MHTYSWHAILCFIIASFAFILICFLLRNNKRTKNFSQFLNKTDKKALVAYSLIAIVLTTTLTFTIALFENQISACFHSLFTLIKEFIANESTSVTNLTTSKQDKDFNSIAGYFGVASAIVLSFIIPILLSTTPSLISTKIEKVLSSQATHLDSSDRILQEAYSLFREYDTENDSKVRYTSSTPYFGLYTQGPGSNEGSKKIHARWKELVKNRLTKATTSDRIETTIVALSWEPFRTGRSSLYSSCRRICKASAVEIEDLLKEQGNTAIERMNSVHDLYSKSLDDWKHFRKDFTSVKAKNTKVLLSHSMYDFFVFYAESTLKASCIIAIISKDDKNFGMRGFRTSDERWLEFARNIFSTFESNCPDISSYIREDRRTEAQEDRDKALLNYFCLTSHSPRRPIYIGLQEKSLQDLIDETFSINTPTAKSPPPKHRTTELVIAQNKYVAPVDTFEPKFPTWSKAIQWTFDRIRHARHKRKTIAAIDINTGCGILAFALALEGCNNVIAIESDAKAMANALMNQNRLHSGHGSISTRQRNIINFYCGNGLEQLEEGSSIANKTIGKIKDLKNSIIVITLNHLYYKSYFCTMNHKFQYDKIGGQNPDNSFDLKE